MNIGDTVTVKNRLTKKTFSGEITGYDDDNHPLGGAAGETYFVHLGNGKDIKIDVLDFLSLYKIVPSGV